ncbi:MAG: dihydropteroate synthase [Paludibacteraceae bacterium]
MQILTRHGLLGLEKPVVMAILNITPDSFVPSTRLLGGQKSGVSGQWSVTADEEHGATPNFPAPNPLPAGGAGEFLGDEERVLAQAERALAEGAAILDIGGYSTRPGAAEVSEEEEWRRVAMGLAAIRRRFPEAVVSVDTFRPEVARRAVDEYETDIINDISGGCEEMYAAVAERRVPYVLMHMRGTPKTMQQMTDYEDIMSEMMAFFQTRVDCLHRMGVADVIVDPGFGFAKTVAQNYEVLRRMQEFEALGCPLLAGLSRKSMFYKPLGITPEEALNATTAANMLALERGAHILRVHDVRAAVETVEVYWSATRC